MKRSKIPFTDASIHGLMGQVDRVNQQYDCPHCRDTRRELVELDSDRLPATGWCSWCMVFCMTCKTMVKRKGHTCPKETTK